MAETTAPLAQAADEINHTHTEWMGDIVRDVTDQNEIVAVLGLTYKPGVPVTQESQGIELVSYLDDELDVIAYDPIASLDAAKRSSGIIDSDDVEESIATADTAILTIKHDILIDESIYKDITLIDPWRVFEAEDLHDSVIYRPLGRPE
jgi:UDP-N-acetyl-D-mannosaminuronate dehydrogenase